jgi:hypothetical protein
MIVWADDESYISWIGFGSVLFGVSIKYSPLIFIGTTIQLSVVATYYTRSIVPIILTGMLAGLAYAI